MSTNHHATSGPEGTLSALGCVLVIYLAGLVSGVLVSVGYLWWTIR